MRQVFIGGAGKTRRLGFGGASPVSIQTMWKASIADTLHDRAARTRLLADVETLEALGCDAVRFAVPDAPSADALVKLAAETQMPFIADIHFDYRLALRCLEGNVAKVRVNPGTIGNRERVKAVAERCRDKGAAIRIGV
ncbi:flavodoxin-dependent (E)-4-hydroxy-3-methylbut-2-enyl-diphosphate synthase, partial [Treponema endosymbiont of Eucomonympha sp.]|uniref:flavodoxin-dependent (E)-4-hydroxy-3-methylbut-2-enyl-diphosphate synthase n=1 Tax=Treponema endosymbiont of Eucomonympha sp. TaxID=1580831 RepID=UPI000A4A986E